MKDGELTKDGQRRWCKGCNQEHGFLCLCESYPEEIKKEIRNLSNKFVENLNDPYWVRQQNIPPEVLTIFKFFAGIK